MNNEVQMFSSAWFEQMGLSNGQVIKITALIAISLVLALAAAVLLASPVMSALGMTALLG